MGIIKFEFVTKTQLLSHFMNTSFKFKLFYLKHLLRTFLQINIRKQLISLRITITKIPSSTRTCTGTDSCTGKQHLFSDSFSCSVQLIFLKVSVLYPCMHAWYNIKVNTHTMKEAHVDLST